MKLKSYMTAAAVIGMMVMAHAASAASVTFSTSGSFLSSGTSVAQSDNVLTGAPLDGNSTLTFTGAPSTNVGLIGGLGFANFGTFALTFASGTELDAYSDLFTLSITQSAPPAVPNSGSTTSTVSGLVTSDGSTVFVTFAGPVTITNSDGSKTIYTIDPVKVPSPLSNNGTATVQGQIELTASLTQETPLPAAAFGGMGLLGVFGVSRRRNRTAA